MRATLFAITCLVSPYHSRRVQLAEVHTRSSSATEAKAFSSQASLAERRPHLADSTLVALLLASLPASADAHAHGVDVQRFPRSRVRRVEAAAARLARLQLLRGGAVTAKKRLGPMQLFLSSLNVLRKTVFPGNPERERAIVAAPEPEKKAAAPAAAKPTQGVSTKAGVSRTTSKARQTRSTTASRSGGVQAIHSKAEFERMLAGVRSKQLVVVDFYATWCGPCKEMAPKYEAMSKDFPQAKFVKVDVDKAKDLQQKYGVTAMPTFKLLRGGNEVDSVRGADEGALREKVGRLAGPRGVQSVGAGRSL